MRRIVLGTFLLAEIAGILVYFALDGVDDLAAFEPDGDRFGDVLSQAYEDIAWADAVRRSMLAEGVQGTGAGIRQNGGFKVEASGRDDDRSVSGVMPLVPLAAVSETAIPVPISGGPSISGTGQNR